MSQDPNNTISFPVSPAYTVGPATIAVPAITSSGFITLIYNGSSWITNPSTLAPEEAPAEEKESEGKGCLCAKCNELNEYAIPNQLDGTFICYACRQG